MGRLAGQLDHNSIFREGFPQRLKPDFARTANGTDRAVPLQIDSRTTLTVKLLYVTRLSLTGVLRRPFVQNKLLDDAENHTAADANRCTANHKSYAAVLTGIVGIR